VSLLHEALAPDSYLEISQHPTEVLNTAGCPTVAITLSGGDATIAFGSKPRMFVFRGDGTSFFERFDPRLLLGGAIDLALLNGLPLLEVMLRDFCDLERHCRPGSVVLFNNCLPIDGAMAGRDPEELTRRAGSAHPDWWTGDAWKLLPILRSYRPDLTLHLFDAQPSGLLAVTGLDPASTVLADGFDAIVTRYRDLAALAEAELFAQCQAGLVVRGTHELAATFVLERSDPPAGAPEESRDVYRFIDPAHLPRIDAPALLAGSADGRHPEDPDVPRSFFRAAPLFIDDPAGSGVIAPFGNDTIRYRGSSVLSFRDALLVGYRSILTASGQLVHDETQVVSVDMGRLADKLSCTDDAFLNEHTLLSPVGNSGTFTLDPGDREVVEIDEPVVVMCSNEPSNYGSFIYRVLPKLRSVRRLELDGVRMLIHAPQQHHREFLEAFGIAPDGVIHHEFDRIYRLRHAIVPTMRNVMPYLDPGGRRLFEELRQRVGARHGGQRIYLSRLGWSNAGHSVRVLMNEAQLIERLASGGFEIVEPETLSLAEQIRVFSSARMIVGPAGSAFYNTVFCRPGTRIIDIESEPQWVALHSCLFASLGLPYGIVVGQTDPTDPREVHKRWTVDIDAVMSRVERWDDEQSDDPTGLAAEMGSERAA
jgi:capsular polysaccharide biosynthesis protein